MGKRKYESEKDNASKKAKNEDVCENANSEEQPQNEDGVVTTRELTKRHGFDIKHFRKELATKQGQTMVLTQFLQVCLDPDKEVDYILEYLKIGGNSHEILRQINQENKKNLTLATPVFHLFHLIILKVQSSLPHMITITEEASRYFLNNFMSTVEIMISENSGPRHRKIILKLLTSMVTLNSDLGVEVLSQAPLTPKHLEHVVEKANYKEKDNVRPAFVHFMTSFLVDGHLPLIKALLEKQGLLSLVIPGLVHDEGEAVLMFLNILKKNVIDNTFLSKTLKLKTFNHQVLHNMFKLFSWKGPPEMSNEEKNAMRQDILTLVSDIIMTLFTSHKLGLYFVDNSLGTTDMNKNQNLYKALLSLKRPWENEQECDVILNIIHKCPDLHRAIIHVLEQSFEPQHSPIWDRTTQFTIKLLNKLKPEDFSSRMVNLSPIQVANFVRFITLPVPLLKFIHINLGKDQVISLYCVKVLVKMLQTLKRYLQILDMDDTQTQTLDLRNKLEYFFPKHLPAPKVLVSLIQNIIENKKDDNIASGYKLSRPNDTEALISLLDLLLLYNDIHPTYFETLEGNIDMNNILEYSMTLSEGQTSLLKFKIVSLWLTLDSSAISLKNAMFKDLFLIMLDVYISDDGDTWIEAKDTLLTFFKNTSIFETDEDEIHLILYTLRNSKVHQPSLIGDVIEYVLANIQSLTDFVRNQLVHFEISDENSQACLEKLFDDLMENRNTAESVFLENRVPSPFIVGCMQYLQSNKEVKKCLKQFLSLYIANLMHSNYSPELTEVLIGDSKLEVRGYVASWIGQPAPVPESIMGNDSVLKNISKSVIDNEEISLLDVFPYLEESTDETELVINGTYYTVNTSKNVDGSELLIWAKYLIFCIVRLTEISQLNNERYEKITGYFLSVIAICKKHHMMGICRAIILTLFKNPHFLNVYKPLDSGKCESNLLATKFLLTVMTEHKELVNHLNTKHKLLKSYQQKNYNEILKALIKIKKKKNVNSEHTVNVLEVVGLVKEDDIRVLNQIFNTEVDACLRDDKEPSLVLELLRNILDKYSKSITLELQPHILKKTMKLYTDIITNKEANCNLTNLETSMIEYFEKKPYQVTRVPEDMFKKMFDANLVRKTTAQLASVLLTHNVKLSNTFKEQIARPEILSQREITLPLGVAVINHKQFVLENKEFLQTIYTEYKTNINKFIEKPHKAGQIYISSWKFINKLIIECMDVEECEKVYNKIHKFETVELSHMHLIQNIFLKICAADILKKDYAINYILTMLHVITTALKEGKDANVVNEVLLLTKNTVQIATSNVNIKEDLKRVTESSIWQNFCKIVLKDSLKVKTVEYANVIGPHLLMLLTNFVKLFYSEEHEDVVNLFDMVTSHSEFLNVMLSYHSIDIKSRLLELMYVLVKLNKSVMKSQHVPVYLSSYHATRSTCDRLILALLYFYETNGQPVNEFKPYLFGDSAANFYAVRKNKSSSLWSHPTQNQVLNLFDKELIERTVKNFPVTQRLDYNYYELSNDISLGITFKNVLDKISKECAKPPKDMETKLKNFVLKDSHNRVDNYSDVVSVSTLDSDESIYDPEFVFPLLSHLLAPGSVASCFKLLRTGLLSVPVMGLSSHCPMMRAAAYHVLHRFCMLLDTETRHKNDKLFLTDFISTLRQSLKTAVHNTECTDEVQDIKNPRIPAVDALYLARALMVSTSPSDPLYKPVNNFFIAKQIVDLTIVPDFLSLFHDCDVEAADRRIWILDIIKDGTKTLSDVNVIFKTMALKMIMDFYNSVLSDRKVKEKILGVLCSIVAIPRASEILIEGYGLLSWMHGVVRQLSKQDKVLIRTVFTLVSNIVYSMLANSFARSITAKVNPINERNRDFIDIRASKEVEQELAIILFDMLRLVDGLDVDDALIYVKLFKLMSKKLMKNIPKKQMISFVGVMTCLLKNNEQAKLLAKAVASNDGAMLMSKNLVSDDDVRCCLLGELTDVVQTYLA